MQSTIKKKNRYNLLAFPWEFPTSPIINYESVVVSYCLPLQLSAVMSLFSHFYFLLCYFLQNYYPVLFRGVNGTVAHEFIIDLRGFKVVFFVTHSHLSLSSSVSFVTNFISSSL